MSFTYMDKTVWALRIWVADEHFIFKKWKNVYQLFYIKCFIMIALINMVNDEFLVDLTYDKTSH